MTDTILFSYGVSRGRDTYGYYIVTLTSSAQGKKFRCMGGGWRDTLRQKPCGCITTSQVKFNLNH